MYEIVYNVDKLWIIKLPYQVCKNLCLGGYQLYRSTFELLSSCNICICILIKLIKSKIISALWENIDLYKSRVKSEQKIDRKKKESSHDFLFRWAVGPRLLVLTLWGQLSDIDSPASYMPDMLSHAKHRVISIFASRRI